MASYPWESNAGAHGFGDVRHQGGGGGGGGAFEPEAEAQQPRPTNGKGLHEGLGAITGRPEDYSDYGAGGPGEQE